MTRRRCGGFLFGLASMLTVLALAPSISAVNPNFPDRVVGDGTISGCISPTTSCQLAPVPFTVDAVQNNGGVSGTYSFKGNGIVGSVECLGAGSLNSSLRFMSAGGTIESSSNLAIVGQHLYQ